MALPTPPEECFDWLEIYRGLAMLLRFYETFHTLSSDLGSG